MTLEEIRRQIDAIDPQIKELFLKRMATSYEVAKTKYEAGETTIYRADREADIIRRLTADVDPNLVEEYTAMVRKIIEVSRKYQYGLLYDWNPDLFSPLAEGIEIRSTDTRVKIRLTRADACNSMSSILSMIGDYGFNMDEMQLLEMDREQQTVTFELILRGNLNDTAMKKLMFQLSKEALHFRILSSF